MKHCVSLALSIVLAACQSPAPPVHVAARQPARGTLTFIGLADLFARQQADSVLVYDVRPAFVFSFGTIPGAVSWPRRDFDRRLATSETEIRAAGKPVVVFCTDADCPDSQRMAERLVARGHDVSVFKGGYAEWKEAGLPTE